MKAQGVADRRLCFECVISGFGYTKLVWVSAAYTGGARPLSLLSGPQMPAMQNRRMTEPWNVEGREGAESFAVESSARQRAGTASPSPASLSLPRRRASTGGSARCSTLTWAAPAERCSASLGAAAALCRAGAVRGAEGRAERVGTRRARCAPRSQCQCLAGLALGPGAVVLHTP